MSGVKGRSGRKPRREEDRKRLLTKHYPVACDTIAETMKDPMATRRDKLQAAIEIVHQAIGKGMSEQKIQAVIGVMTYGERLALEDRATERARLENTLLTEYSIGGIDAIQREEEYSRSDEEIPGEEKDNEGDNGDRDNGQG